MKYCLRCNDSFSPKSSKAKFCSTKCRVAYSRNTGNRNTGSNEVQSNEVPNREVASNKKEPSLTKINALLKAQGLPPVILGSEYPKLEFVSSNIPEIDALTGGFPRSRITEIFGLKGVGKTALMSKIVASPDITKCEAKIFYIDTENALTFPAPNLYLVANNQLEGVSDLVEEALQGDFDLIVIDSVASLEHRAEAEGESGEAHMGTKAKLMSQWMRRITPYLSKSKAAVVFINQQREAMNPYGPAKYTPGGLGLPYAASLRLELKSNKSDRFEGGHWVHVIVEKSRICKPHQKTKFKLYYG